MENLFWEPFSGHCIDCEKGFYCDAEGMTAPKPCEDGTVSTTTGLKKCEVCPTGAFCTHSGQESFFQLLTPTLMAQLSDWFEIGMKSPN